jgi:RNA polymerase sigma-70 factor (ECF subfamily)
MANDSSFAEFIRRIRAGDEQAAAELVRQYESAIRLEIRLRLRDAHLRRLLDSMDICQSVLASFFVRAAAGQYELQQPSQLLKLLVAMARNKLALQARKHHSQRRDSRRTSTAENALSSVASGHSPDRVAAGRELLREFRQRLTDEERQLADLRALGYDWAEIAAQVGGTPQARRKQLARATDRVARQLGLGGTDEE